MSLEERDTIIVALINWSRVIRCPITDMYILEDRFREMNWLAIPCGLAHLGPVGLRLKKSRALTKLCYEGEKNGSSSP